jgi:hypothetical protein
MIHHNNKPQVGDYLKFIWPEQDKHGFWHDILHEGTVSDVYHDGNQFVIVEDMRIRSNARKFEWLHWRKTATLVSPEMMLDVVES